MIENFGYGMVVPAVVSAVIVFVLVRRRPVQENPRLAASWAVGGGFIAAYVLFPWAPLQPTSPWHWLVYLAVVSAILGPVGHASGISSFERGSLHLIVAVLAASLLVPDWDALQPVRHWYVGSLAAAFWLLSVLLQPLGRRASAAFFGTLLTATTLTGAAVLVLSHNMKFAQLAGVLAAATAGVSVAAYLRRDQWSGLSQSTDSFFAGGILVWTVLLAGLMFTGWMYSFSGVPFAGYALVPSAPLILWAFQFGPLSRLQGAKRLLCQAAVLAVPLLIAVAWAYLCGAE